MCMSNGHLEHQAAEVQPRNASRCLCCTPPHALAPLAMHSGHWDQAIDDLVLSACSEEPGKLFSNKLLRLLHLT